MSTEAICAPESDHDGYWVGVWPAVETTARWTALNLHALYGDAVFECVAVNPHSMLALARAVVDGAIGAQDAGEQRAATLGPLRSASLSDDPSAVGRALRPLQLNCGDFHSWLALAPLLCGEVAPAAAKAEPLKHHRRDVAPLEAVSMMIWGEVWSAARAQARLARAALVNGMLSDDAKGRAGLRGSARLFLQQLQREDADIDARFEAARARLQQSIATLGAEAYSAGAMRSLTSADFATPMWLDVLQGRFVPSPELELMSDEWRLARRACDAIGQVRLSADALLRRKLIALSRSKATAASIKRAEHDLRERGETWLSHAASMPKREDWIAESGARIAGSKRAARGAWRTVTSDPRFAPLRAAGRRRKIEPA